MQSHLPRHARARARLSLAGLALAATATWALPASAHQAAGAVYILSNQAAGNEVWVYQRDRNGTLTFQAGVATGGTGTITPPPPNGAAGIDPLGSQNAVVYHEGLVLAVNAGSNDISLLQVTDDGLRLLDRVPSGGQEPTSIAVRDDLVYVVNAAGTPNISGFKLDFTHRHLIPLAGSTVDLPGGASAAPGEVLIDPHANFIVVTEKGTNFVDTFRITAKGRAEFAAQTPSVGNGPFGFSVGSGGALVVADAGSGAVSSYGLQADGSLDVISGAESLDGQTAPCWLVTSPSGHLAFAADAGTQSISTLSVSGQGKLTLRNANAVTTQGAALDIGLTGDGRYLYVRSADGTDAALPGIVTGYRVGAHGSLTAVNSLADVPPGAQGIAVR